MSRIFTLFFFSLTLVVATGSLPGLAAQSRESASSKRGAAITIDGDIEVGARRMRRQDDQRESLAQFGIRPVLVLRLDGWHDDRWPDRAKPIIALADRTAARLAEHGVETLLFLPHQPKADYSGEIAFHEMHEIAHMQHLYIPERLSFLTEAPKSSAWSALLDLGCGDLALRWALMTGPGEIEAWGMNFEADGAADKLEALSAPACSTNEITKQAFKALADWRLAQYERLLKGIQKSSDSLDDDARAALDELVALQESALLQFRSSQLRNDHGELPTFEQARVLRDLARGPLKGSSIGKSWDAEGRKLERSSEYRAQAKAGATMLELRAIHRSIRDEQARLKTKIWDMQAISGALRKGHDRLKKGLDDFLGRHGDSPWATEARTGLAMIDEAWNGDGGGNEKTCGCEGPCDCP